MAQGREKLKAKFAGVFVSFRGLISLLYLAYLTMTQGATVLSAIAFLNSLGTFFSGLGVLVGSKKAYFVATFLTSVNLLLRFIRGNLLSVFIDLSVLGALWKGCKIQLDESYDVSESVGRHY